MGGYTLNECIIKTPRIRRSRHVIEVLNNNDIYTFDDFVSKALPRIGLWPSEVRVLMDMRKKEQLVREWRRQSKVDFRELIAAHTSKHEATRIFNLLIANGITNYIILRSTPIGKLQEIKGIGQKSVDILFRIKAKPEPERFPYTMVQ